VRGVGAGADRDDAPASAALAAPEPDHAVPGVRRHGAGVPAGDGRAAAGALAQAGGHGAQGTAAGGKAAHRGGAVPARRGVPVPQDPAEADGDRPGSARGPDDEARQAQADEPDGWLRCYRELLGGLEPKGYWGY